MTVNYTSLLGLALPVTGTEAGAWGDVVNNYLTSYLDASVAGTQTITGSQTAVTLAVTNGATLVTVGSGATGSAQFQIITCTGNPASLLTITAPASSRQYIIINSTSTSQSVKIVGAGPTTGVTIVSGEKAHVAWNGSDFVKIATQSGNGSFVDLTVSGNLTLSGGTQNGVLYLNASRVATSGSALTFDGTILNNTGAAPGIRTTLTGGLSYTTVAYDGVYATGTDLYLFAPTGKFVSIYANNAEQMRLTSTGVVIRQSSNSANTSVSLNTTIQNALTLEADGDLLVGTTTNTNSSKLVASGTISETVSSTQYLVASQFDIGTAANEIPLNQYLGNLAYQDAGSIAGQVGLSAGTAALPSLVSATDTDTGMWFPAANTLAWSTGGAERIRVTSGGTFQTSLDASIYGVTVGRGAGAVATNTAVGASALAANTTGNGATAIGASALAGVNISAYATAVGYNALNANTSGEANAGFGAYSLFKTTSGAYNTGAGVGALQNNITGANNTAVGYTALINNTASSNTAVGHQAGYSNETGTYLTLVGYQAGFSNTVNSPQTSIGYQAGYFQTGTVVALGYRAAYGASGTSTGNFNTAIGDLALQANTTASNNTAVGYQSLYSNTTSSNGAAFGYQAMYANNGGLGNAAFGYIALKANTTGFRNTAVGSDALTANTTAYSNTAVGYSSLVTNTTGQYNTAIGDNALYSNTTGVATFGTVTGGSGYTNGTYNGVQLTYSSGTTATTYPTANIVVSGGAVTTVTLVSAGTGFKDTTTVLTAPAASIGGTGSGFTVPVATLNAASNNTAVGYQAGYSNTTGAPNEFFGYRSGYQNTTGSQNAGFGYRTLDGTTTGSQNAAFGSQAMQSNQTGSNNTALGSQALLSNLSASNNTAVGYQAGYSNQVGTSNVAIGYKAGYSNNSNGYNTFVGDRSGTDSTGQNNTFIGQESGNLVTSGAKNTILGRYNGYTVGGLDIRTASNYIVLSDGDGNARMYANAAAWTNPGTMNVGGMTTYTQYSQSFSLGTTQWIRLCQLGNPGTMRIKYFLGSSNSEEYGEVFINATYVTSGNQITVNRQSYNSHLLEVRLVASSGGFPYDVFFNIRSDQLAPSITWTPFDVRANSFTIYNDTTSPGAASSSLVLETGSATSSNITATNGLYGAYGGGVQFPATQVASSNANTLDDYEEGTWTPAVRGALTAGTYELATAEGSYVKIGKQVTLTCRVVFAAAITGGGTGYLQITGAPSFNNAAAAYGAVSQSGLDMTTNYTWLTASFISTSGTTILYLDENGDSVSSSDFPISGVTANDSIRFSITYIST